ncbi:hypothetical protein VRK_06780 [Vibrio sp. MEBiC08052]|nr:hypothetical protein VRK_06780 [Vibrio sp. MEBiC08052]
MMGELQSMNDYTKEEQPKLLSLQSDKMNCKVKWQDEL